MAIYRPTRPRYKVILATGALGLAIGLVAGLALGGEDPDPVETARDVRVSLSEAASVLEIVEIEYSEAWTAQGDVGGQEFEGAQDALARSEALWGEARGTLSVLAPDRAAEIDDHYDRLEEEVASGAEPKEVATAIDRLSTALEPDDP